MKSSEELYLVLDEVIATLDSGGFVGFANVLRHRIRTVAWTSASELFEELIRVLEAHNSEPIAAELRLKIDESIRFMKKYLAG